MTTFDAAVRAISAYFDGLLPNLPVTMRSRSQQEFQLLLDRLHGCRANDNHGAQKYWKTYRDNQKFSVETHGEGIFTEEVITGRDELLKLLGWKESTLRLRLSQNHGQLSVRKGSNFLTIKRIEK